MHVDVVKHEKLVIDFMLFCALLLKFMLEYTSSFNIIHNKKEGKEDLNNPEEL